MYKKKSCCLCHAAQNWVWFSFWLLHFPLTTHLIWCALSLPDLITSFLELACCSNWFRGKNAIKWASNSIPAIAVCICMCFVKVLMRAWTVLCSCYLLKVPQTVFFCLLGLFVFFHKSLFLYGIQAKDRVALSSGLVVQGQRFQGRSDFPPMLLHLRTVNLKTLGSPGPCRCRLFALHTVLWPDPSSKYWFHHAWTA